MTTQKPVIYRLTGAAPGTAAVITYLTLGAKDSNIELTLHPVKRGGRSYVANIALGFAVSPGTATRFTMWGVLASGSLDQYVTVKIAKTLPVAYIAATGTEDVVGTGINSLYGLETEDFLAYTSSNPYVISPSDLIKTSGTGIYTKTIPIQIEIGSAAALGAIPASPVTLKLYCAAMES